MQILIVEIKREHHLEMKKIREIDSVLQVHSGKFMIFSITQILREINFGEPRSEKSALLIHLEAMTFDFHEFLHFLKLKFTKSTKFRVSRMA